MRRGVRDVPPRKFRGRSTLLNITHADSQARVYPSVEAALTVTNRPLLRTRRASDIITLGQDQKCPSTSGPKTRHLRDGNPWTLPSRAKYPRRPTGSERREGNRLRAYRKEMSS